MAVSIQTKTQCPQPPQEDWHFCCLVQLSLTILRRSAPNSCAKILIYTVIMQYLSMCYTTKTHSETRTFSIKSKSNLNIVRVKREKLCAYAHVNRPESVLSPFSFSLFSFVIALVCYRHLCLLSLFPFACSELLTLDSSCCSCLFSPFTLVLTCCCRPGLLLSPLPLSNAPALNCLLQSVSKPFGMRK